LLASTRNCTEKDLIFYFLSTDLGKAMIYSVCFTKVQDPNELDKAILLG
jgi:hypothetical protein